MRRRYLAATGLWLLLLIWFIAEASAQEPTQLKLDIRGDTTILVNSLPFHVSLPVASPDEVATYIWQYNGLQVVSDTFGPEIEVAEASDGRHTIGVLKIVSRVTEDGKPVQERFRGTVSFIVGSPEPPPPPPPPVPVPEGAYGMTKLSHDEARKVASTYRAKASQLASNFESVASAIAAGGFTTVDQANTELKSKNQQVLSTGPQRDAWVPWFTIWKQRADKHNNDGTLRTLQHYQSAYTATADGLRLVK